MFSFARIKEAAARTASFYVSLYLLHVTITIPLKRITPCRRVVTLCREAVTGLCGSITQVYEAITQRRKAITALDEGITVCRETITSVCGTITQGYIVPQALVIVSRRFDSIVLFYYSASSLNNSGCAACVIDCPVLNTGCVSANSSRLPSSSNSAIVTIAMRG